jgi:hypothetical protein
LEAISFSVDAALPPQLRRSRACPFVGTHTASRKARRTPEYRPCAEHPHYGLHQLDIANQPKRFTFAIRAPPSGATVAATHSDTRPTSARRFAVRRRTHLLVPVSGPARPLPCRQTTSAAWRAWAVSGAVSPTAGRAGGTGCPPARCRALARHLHPRPAGATCDLVDLTATNLYRRIANVDDVRGKTCNRQLNLLVKGARRRVRGFGSLRTPGLTRTAPPR